MSYDKFNEEFAGWKTPNTYGNNFGVPPQKSGVYLLLRLFDGNNPNYEIMYIGSAKYLYQRYERHEVKRVLQKIFGYIQFYWIQVDEYRELEKELIKKYQPKFNSQWR